MSGVLPRNPPRARGETGRPLAPRKFLLEILGRQLQTIEGQDPRRAFAAHRVCEVGWCREAAAKGRLDENDAVFLAHNFLVGDHSLTAPVSPRAHCHWRRLLGEVGGRACLTKITER